MPRALPPGVYRDRTGYRAVVCVRPFPHATRRFPADTPIRAITAWRNEARARLQRRRRLVRHATAAGTLAADVETYFRQWGAGKSPLTIKVRRQHLRDWIDAFPQRSRASLTPAEIRAQLLTWQRTRHYRPASLDGRRTSLHHLFRVLDAGTGDPNPVDLVPTCGSAREWRMRPPHAVTYDSIVATLEAIRPCRTRARLALLAFTGLRPVELQRITPADIAPDYSHLLIRTAKHGPARRLPLLPQAQQALREFVALDAFGAFASGALRHTWTTARTRAQQPPCRVYDLRHSFGTELYRQTGDIKLTAELLRHSSLSMTERYISGAVGPRLQTALQSVTLPDLPTRG